MGRMVWDMVGMVGGVMLTVGIARISTEMAFIVVGIMLLMASIGYALGEVAKKRRSTERDQ